MPWRIRDPRADALEWLAAIVLAAVASLCVAHAASGGDGADRWSATTAQRGAPLTKRIAFVLDVSGSMAGDPIEHARGEIRTILELFADDGLVRVFAFSDAASEFEIEGCKGKWHRLPSEEVSKAAMGFYASFEPRGGTRIGEAIAMVMSECVEDDLSIVLVTDGEIVDSAIQMEVIETAQMSRDVPSVIHVILMRESVGGFRDSRARDITKMIAGKSGSVRVVGKETR